MEKSLTQSYLPMSESTYLMMIAMQAPIHGYGIILKVEKLTKGRIHLGAGTIYGALTRFEKDGVILPAGELERKKLYVLSDIGKQLLMEEYQRICELQSIGEEELIRE